MSLINKVTLISLFLILISCSTEHKFPEKVCERTSADQVELSQNLFNIDNLVTDRIENHLSELSQNFNEMLLFVNQYELKDEKFDLRRLEELWESAKKEKELNDFISLSAWIDITGFLIELTGNPKYGVELQDLIRYSKLSLSENEMKQLEQKISPFIYTRDVDNVYLNLVTNSSTHFDHSLKGKVRITIEKQTEGKALVKFNMENKRVIELFILIPEWAKSASVTEKNVKYVANPGEYCHILRKWSDGDKVEINLED